MQRAVIFVGQSIGVCGPSVLNDPAATGRLMRPQSAGGRRRRRWCRRRRQRSGTEGLAGSSTCICLLACNHMQRVVCMCARRVCVICYGSIWCDDVMCLAAAVGQLPTGLRACSIQPMALSRVRCRVSHELRWTAPLRHDRGGPHPGGGALDGLFQSLSSFFPLAVA